MRKLIVLAALLALVLTGSAFAQTADEVILLAQKGVGEDVLMAFVEASRVPFALSVADIVKLKDANVPDKVVVAMLRRHPAASVAIRPRAVQEAQPEYPVRRDDSQVQVEYQPAPQSVVGVPSTTYVYSGYPYTYDSSYGYPYYYPYCYPYYCPSVSLGFGGGRSFHHSDFSNFHSGFQSGSGPGHSFHNSHFSNLHTGGFSNFHSGFQSSSGFGGSGHHSSVSVGGGGGFHGRR